MKHSWQLCNLMWPLSHQFTSFFCIYAFILTTFTGSIDGCSIILSNCLERRYLDNYRYKPIILQVGEPLELVCSINMEPIPVEHAEGATSRVEDLVFKKNDQIIEPRYITRINQTTIRLFMENQQELEQTYVCYLNRNYSTELSGDCIRSIISNVPQQEPICMNYVKVRQEPPKVENFTCISWHWQQLNCSWVVPKNYVPTNYTIQYFPKNLNGEEAPCPTNDDLKQNYCLWTLTSKPPYRKSVETLKFIVTGRNNFTSIEQTFTFDHYAHILMDRPKDLRLLAKNATNMTLQWNIGDMQYFPKPLDYKILYKSSNDSDWNTFLCQGNDRSQEGDRVWCTIANLTPNELYSFRVFMKSGSASDKYWSTNYTSSVFRTNSISGIESE